MLPGFNDCGLSNIGQSNIRLTQEQEEIDFTPWFERDIVQGRAVVGAADCPRLSQAGRRMGSAREKGRHFILFILHLIFILLVIIVRMHMHDAFVCVSVGIHIHSIVRV